MDTLRPNDFSRFTDFDIHSTPYKTASTHPITADVLVPSTLTKSATPSPTPSSPPPASPRPLLLRFHGGGLVAGSSLFPGFFAPWHLSLAARHSAIIVTPNYRLLPEASLPEILADIEDFWVWVHEALPSFVEERTNGAVRVDTSRILTAGDSAGGYLSLLLALRHPDAVRAATAAYPMVDVRSPHFCEAYDKPMFGVPQQPRSVVDEHVEKVRSGALPAVVSADPALERATLMFACVQHGVLGRAFPRERRDLALLEALADGARFPRGGVFVWHARGDSVVPIEGSRRLEEMVRELDPGLGFRLYQGQGEHGFDLDTSIEEDWMADGLRPVVAAWLA
ncbi:Alpha/Beta hydrolase protein [Macrophomina phaseolina]|uniref:Alpha/Beta hydrolase protein n=1 Tax=Macrophomina phaseolina TaxID=35725 RepID=A0ABQ8FSY6_9PEZI|nr:Alpha/Beta hydrolase protein [Macrophomina phaseolina]